ncbi:MAG: holo-ACP synthase [Buchnera aphidicola (Chaetogeoica yunlongensis)]
MSIFGIGIDILSIKRITNIIKKKLDKKFSYRILSNYELNILLYNNYNKKNYTKFLANRFVIKEAVSKALGTGMKYGLKFNNLEIRHNKEGKPYLKFLSHAKKITKNINIKNIHISLSDEKLYVCAIVIIEN